MALNVAGSSPVTHPSQPSPGSLTEHVSFPGLCCAFLSGMSKKEVEMVIGLPAGDYLTRPPTGDWRALCSERERGGKPWGEHFLSTQQMDGKTVSISRPS